MRSVFSTLESPTPWPARFPELVYQIPFVSLIIQSSAQKEKGGWEFWLGIKKHRIKSKGLGVRRSGWAPGINSYLLLSLSFLIYKKRLMVVMTSARQPHSSVLGSMRLWKAKAFVTTKLQMCSPGSTWCTPRSVLDSAEGPKQITKLHTDLEGPISYILPVKNTK